METKKCNKCGKEKPVSEFYRSTTSTDGLQNYCKECQKENRTINYKGRRLKELDTTTPERENVLSSFTPRELMKELHKRGYEGELIFVNRVDISKM